LAPCSPFPRPTWRRSAINFSTNFSLA
jgi:hypothetical protein